MNLRIGNLTTLKRHLLAAPLAAGTGPTAAANIIRDDVLTTLGLGVGLQIEQFCGREFGYMEGATTIFSGDRLTFVLPRYPIASIAAVETRSSFLDAWTPLVITNVIAWVGSSSGLVELLGVPRGRFAEVRVTYTGGYWFDETEDESGVQPNGAPEMPGDIAHAWLLQCQEVWNKRDKLGINLNSKPDERVGIAKLTLTEGVQEILRPHQRMQLS